jgi:hypothetical protein
MNPSRFDSNYKPFSLFNEESLNTLGMNYFVTWFWYMLYQHRIARRVSCVHVLLFNDNKSVYKLLKIYYFYSIVM